MNLEKKKKRENPILGIVFILLGSFITFNQVSTEHGTSLVGMMKIVLSVIMVIYGILIIYKKVYSKKNEEK